MRLCACGCGQTTKPYTTTDKRIEAIKGEFAKWIKGHHPPRMPPPLSPLKVCNVCSGEFPRTREFFFPHQGRHRDKLSAICKSCSTAKQAEWVARNKDSVKEYMRLYRINNREKVREGIRRWAAAHPDYAATNGAAWREANYESYMARVRKYREENKDICQAAVKLYKGRKRAAYTGRVAAAEIIARHAEYGGLCGICGCPVSFPDASWDHIEPISKGGKHELSNLQPCHRICNSMKGNRPLLDTQERIRKLQESGVWEQKLLDEANRRAKTRSTKTTGE